MMAREGDDSLMVNAGITQSPLVVFAIQIPLAIPHGMAKIALHRCTCVKHKAARMSFAQASLGRLKLNSSQLCHKADQKAECTDRNADLDIGFVATLNALHKADSHTRSEMRVLSIGLTTPTPPGVPEDVDVGPKAVQSPATSAALHCSCSICLASSMSTYCILDLAYVSF